MNKLKDPLYLECECQTIPPPARRSPQCGKLYVADFGGLIEIGYVKYPKRTETEGCILLGKNTCKKLIKYIQGSFKNKI